MSGPLLNIPRTGNRRKNIPTLPSSAFDTSNPIPAPGKTPLPPSPSKIHPSVVIDSRVSISSLEDAEKWKATEDNKLESSILSLDFPNLDDGVEAVDKLKGIAALSVLSISLPFPLSSGRPANDTTIPKLSSTSRTTLSEQVTRPTVTPAFIEGMKWALEENHSVDLDVRVPPQNAAQPSGESNPRGGYDYLEELIEKAQEGLPGMADEPNEAINPKTPAIIISNVLPPPVGCEVPTQKLVTDAGYLAYQSHIASLSLHKNTYLALLPPVWSLEGLSENGFTGTKERSDWKRRIKLYLGPAIEAFGEYRILYGSSPVSVFDPAKPSIKINAQDWYKLAREVITELGVEQEGVEAIFHGNARKVFTT